MWRVKQPNSSLDSDVKGKRLLNCCSSNNLVIIFQSVDRSHGLADDIIRYFKRCKSSTSRYVAAQHHLLARCGTDMNEKGNLRVSRNQEKQCGKEGEKGEGMDLDNCS